MSSPMGTFLAGIQTVIEATSITADFQLRRDVEIKSKKSGKQTYIVLSPMEEITVRPESPTSYLAQPVARMRLAVVYPTDASAITALTDLFQAVRNALFGQSFSGRRSLTVDIKGEYAFDDTTTNLYYLDLELTGEYQVSTT